MGKLRATARRHPRVVDAGLAVLIACLSVPSTAEAGTTGLGWLWFTAIHLPLVWRRRAPVVVFWVAFASLGVSDLLGEPLPAQIIVPLVAIYAVARHRPLRHVAVAAGAFGLALGQFWRESDPLWPVPVPVIAISAVLTATILLGITARTRRAYLDELEERARRLERERDQQAQLAAVAERARIAREMHDIVAHNLAVMVALADGAAFAAKATPERAADAMRKVSDTGREALAETRRLLGLLRDGDPPPPGAERLTVSDATVKTHVRHLLTKLALRDRVHLVVFAYETGVVRPGAG